LTNRPPPCPYPSHTYPPSSRPRDTPLAALTHLKGTQEATAGERPSLHHLRSPTGEEHACEQPSRVADGTTRTGPLPQRPAGIVSVSWSTDVVWSHTLQMQTRGLSESAPRMRATHSVRSPECMCMCVCVAGSIPNPEPYPVAHRRTKNQTIEPSNRRTRSKTQTQSTQPPPTPKAPKPRH